MTSFILFQVIPTYKGRKYGLGDIATSVSAGSRTSTDPGSRGYVEEARKRAKLELHVEMQDTKIEHQQQEIERLKQLVEGIVNLQVPASATAQSGVAQQSTSVDHIPASDPENRARPDEERPRDP